MDISDEVTVKKSKRLTSVVWDHFERVRKAEICYAVCVHCNKKLSGSSNSGTTHLRNHLMRCLKRSNYDVSQLLAAKRRKKENAVTVANIGFDEAQRKEEYIKPTIIKFEHDQKKHEILNIGSSKFDQERSQLDLARMIILHGYPLSIVDQVGFKVFVKNLQPMFDVVPNNSIELSCMQIYGKERQRVYEIIHKLHGRINLAVEMWSSPENAEFMCLTAHYIDDDWMLQKKVLNFVTLDTYHTEDMLCGVIVQCLMDWNIDCKLFSITFDHCSTDDGIVSKIKDQISQHKPMFSDSQLLDVRSAVHVLNSIVEDMLETIRDVIQKIRASFRHVRSSQLTQGRFNEIAQQVGINSQRGLRVDSPLRWNSTYQMLDTAIEYRDAFTLLLEQDAAYLSALTDEEWEWASVVAGHLKLLVEITNELSGNRCSTANIFFPEMCNFHIHLIEGCKSPDGFVSSMASKMKTKFDKYWNKCSLVLAAATILDPRFKMKLVEYYYSQIYGSTAVDRIKEVSDGIKELFNAYALSPTLDNGSGMPGSSLLGTGNDAGDRLKGFDQYLHETAQTQSTMSDLDKYLEEPVFPRNGDFSLLNWWKVHTPRYPILSMMAHDMLGIPMSTVALESAFSSGGRVVDHSRSSLNPDTRQALICAQDWLHSDSGDHNPSGSHSAASLFVEAK